MKRTIMVGVALLLCVPGWSQFQPLPIEKIAGPNRSISDPQARLSVTVPVGWTPRRVGRSEKGETSIAFASPKTPAAAPSLYYHFTDAPRGTPSADMEAHLRESAQKKAEQRVGRDGYPGYANRAESFVFRTIGGLPALSWEATYTREERPWSEYLTRIVGTNGAMLFFLNAPADDMPAIRPVFERMIETARIGAPVTAQIGEMAFVQLLDVARLAPKGTAPAPDGMVFTFLVARNPGITGPFTIKETRDMGIAGQSYQRATQQSLGKVFEPGTTMNSAAEFLAQHPKLGALAAVDPSNAQLLTIELPGAALDAGKEAAIHLNVGFNKAVEKLTFFTKVPGRVTFGD